MVVTTDTRASEIVEALSHLSVGRVAARERGDQAREQALTQEIEQLLDASLDRLPQKNPASSDVAPECSQPLSPRHRPEKLGPASSSREGTGV